MAGSAPLQWRSCAGRYEDAQPELRAPAKTEEAGLEARWGGRPPTASKCQNEVVRTHSKEPSMTRIARIGIDTSKSTFQLHGVDEREQVVLRSKLRRRAFLTFFAKLEPTVIGLEACGGSHYWARELAKLGHEVVLIPPQYVKPYVARGKNDAAD